MLGSILKVWWAAKILGKYVFSAFNTKNNTHLKINLTYRWTFYGNRCLSWQKWHRDLWVLYLLHKIQIRFSNPKTIGQLLLLKFIKNQNFFEEIIKRLKTRIRSRIITRTCPYLNWLVRTCFKRTELEQI